MKKLISLLLVITILTLGCQEKDSQNSNVTPTVTTPGEQTPSEAPVDENEYNPKDNRMENLQLSLDKDKYSYEPDANAGEYDESYTMSVEAEDGVTEGKVTVESSHEGFSGSGYAFIHDQGTGDAVTVKISVPADGFYCLSFRIAASMGEKKNNIILDGLQIGEVACPKEDSFQDYAVDGIYITHGEHDLVLKASWGWILYDSCTVIATKQPVKEEHVLKKAELVDKKATLRTQMLYQFINDVRGKYTISGQYAQKGINSNEFAVIEGASGRLPAILGIDLIDYSPSRAAHSMPDNVIQRGINFYKKEGGIVTVSWHWNAPKQYIREGEEWWRGFYGDAVDMNLPAIMNGEDKEGYDALIQDIDSIAFYLKQIAEEDVPILWRPLHEASGGWFWWGNYGSEPFIKLWQTMYDRLVNHHEIHNLIWVWNGQNADWYPGDEYVDVIGEDIYPGNRIYSSQSIKYNEASAYTEKDVPVVLSENGCLTDPDLMLRDNAMWTWFCVWSGEFVCTGVDLSEEYNESVMWDKVYNHSSVITLDELPDLTTYGQ